MKMTRGRGLLLHSYAYCISHSLQRLLLAMAFFPVKSCLFVTSCISPSGMALPPPPIPWQMGCHPLKNEAQNDLDRNSLKLMFHLIYMKEFYIIGIKNAKINFLTKILWTKEHWFFERKKKKERFFRDISKKKYFNPNNSRSRLQITRCMTK